MFKPGPVELIIILVIVLVIFGGRGKISAIMGDVGSGLKAFKKSVKDDEDETAEKAPEPAKTEEASAISEEDKKED